MEDLNHILLFKTDIKCIEDKLKLRPLLDTHQQIKQWNVDLHDEDCVLRIISSTLKHQEVILLINNSGYNCTELE